MLEAIFWFSNNFLKTCLNRLIFVLKTTKAKVKIRLVTVAEAILKVYFKIKV